MPISDNRAGEQIIIIGFDLSDMPIDQTTILVDDDNALARSPNSF